MLQLIVVGRTVILLFLLLKWPISVSGCTNKGISETNGVTSLNCTGSSVIAKFQFKMDADDIEINEVNIDCDEMESISLNVESRPAVNMVYVVEKYISNISNESIKCTLYGCYQTFANLGVYFLPNSSCIIHPHDPGIFSATPVVTSNEDLLSMLQTNVTHVSSSTTLIFDITDTRYSKTGITNYILLVVILFIGTTFAVLLIVLLVTAVLSWYRRWKRREDRISNLHFHLEIKEEFDPDYNPISIVEKVISNSTSIDSLEYDVLVYNLSEESSLSAPADYLYADNHVIMEDTNYTGSGSERYFECSEVHPDSDCGVQSWREDSSDSSIVDCDHRHSASN